jgi:uncharacterized membrane protein (DUF4010 family)
MFVRNLALLLIFSPPAGFIAAVPITLMALSAAGFAWWRGRFSVDPPQLKIGSPISLRQVASFGFFFVAIQIAGSLSQRFLGQYGAVLVSALGGLVSSASSTAAVASLSKHGEIRPLLAALATVLASVASTLVNLPILYRQTHDRKLIQSLLIVSLFITVLGLVALGILDTVHLN